MSRFFRNDKSATAQATAPARALIDDLVADRLDRLQGLVDAAEALIAETASLVDADSNLSRQYRGEVIQPWTQDVLAAHQAFRDSVISSLPALREAARLVRAGEARLALQNYGDLLVNLREHESDVGRLKREKPDGIPRISIHQTAGLRRRPSLQAEFLLATLLEGQAGRADLGEVEVTDTTSRLVIEGVEAQEIQVRLHDRVLFVWNHPALVEASV